MIITCEECNSSFNVSDSLIKETGSKVRCSKCDSVFVAYPQPPDDDLALESDDRAPEQDENLELEDFDSSLGDFLSEDEADDDTPEAHSTAEEVELNLDNFDDTLEPGSEKALIEDDDELELDLNFDQDEDSGLELSEDEAAGDELPDLSDLEDLDDIEDWGALDEEEMTADEDESGLGDLELELEDNSSDEAQGADLELEDDGGLNLELDAADQDDGEDADSGFEVEEADELDLTDLELAIDDETVAATVEASGSEDLGIDLDAEASISSENSDEGLKMEESDELDLSDLEINLEGSADSQEASPAGSDDLDFDLDLDLESEEADAKDSEAETEKAASGDDELDLSDLSDIMDEEAAPTAETQPEDLDLELELESDAPADEDASAIADGSKGIEELDLSDLGDIMETEEVSANQSGGEDAAQDIDLDMDLEMEGSSPTAAAASEAGDELDFSDLEELLESDETPTIETTDEKNTEELELQFDLDQPSSEDEPAAATGQAEDDDFLDIEQMLEEGEATTSDQAADYAAEITDLPLEMEAALDDASKGAEAELELDFDLESELQEKEDMFDGGPSEDQQLESNLLASDEADFLEEADVHDTQFQNGPETSVIGTDDFATDEFTATQGAYGATHVLPSGEEDSAAMAEQFYAEEPAARGSHPRSKKPVFVVLLLLLLAVGVIVVPNMLGIKIPYLSDIKIPYLSDLDVKIPYLSDWLNPEGQDVAGNLKLIPLGNTINGKFVDNSKAGQIFVIEGQIENDYDHPRSRIKVTGKLYQKGNKMAKKSTVFCGNVLSDSDLAAMDMSTIRKRLMNTIGDRRSNLKVKKGQKVPFMIVFDNLPKNLDEYTVEVEGSSI